MEDSVIAVYRRADGKWFLHPFNITTAGVHLAGPPFIMLPPGPDLMTDLTEAVAGLVDRAPGRVPHPKVFDQLAPLYEMAGCRDWRRFSKNALYFEIRRSGGKVSVIPTTKEGAGYSHSTEAAVEFDRASLGDRLGPALASLMGSV